jgi:hypothetical protein
MSNIFSGAATCGIARDVFADQHNGVLQGDDGPLKDDTA